MDTRPSFFTLILSPLMEDQLEIPPHFSNEYLSRKKLKKVTLTGPSGTTRAMVQYASSGTHFVRGWCDFDVKHGLEVGDFLAFFYDGGASFEVVIYKANGCLKGPSFKHKITNKNIGLRSRVKIPTAFAKKHLLNTKPDILFEDSKGISWLVSVLADHRGHGRFYMSGGWKAFADARSIEEGDVCVFELADAEHVGHSLLRVTILKSHELQAYS